MKEITIKESKIVLPKPRWRNIYHNKAQNFIVHYRCYDEEIEEIKKSLYAAGFTTEDVFNGEMENLRMNEKTCQYMIICSSLSYQVLAVNKYGRSETSPIVEISRKRYPALYRSWGYEEVCFRSVHNRKVNQYQNGTMKEKDWSFCTLGKPTLDTVSRMTVETQPLASSSISNCNDHLTENYKLETTSELTGLLCRQI